MKIGLVVGAGVATAALAVADTLYRTRQWGATAREAAMPLPGDALVDDPARTVTRGVTVRAAPEDVWRWVVEVGRARGGVELVAGRSMVLLGGLADAAEQAPRETVTTLHVVPLERRGAPAATGEARCRLVCRSRVRRTNSLVGTASVVLEPVGLVLTRRLLLGIKERAEQALRPSVATG